MIKPQEFFCSVIVAIQRMSSTVESPLEPIVSEVDLPVIDFTKLPQELDDELSHFRDHPMLAKLREACIKWGFFRLVNHGISSELLHKVQNVSRGLLSMTTEAKDTAATSNPFDSYSRIPTFETFNVLDTAQSGSLEKICSKLWPQGNQAFCETMVKYNLCVSDLAKKITKIILASLGLDAKAFYRSHFENCTSRLRVNGYSSRERIIGEESLRSHADSGCLTILYQDDAGGLEIRSLEGNWFNFKPLSDSFVINLGDSLKAWSNGRYRSAEHRVVYNGWRERISIGFFTFFPDETEICAPEELVDDENPRRYKPFVFSQFRHELRTNSVGIDRATTLERFAGI